MRFLVDESAGSAIAAFLRHLGHDVLAVTETMPQADDSAILGRAVKESRIVVTNDKDFGELIFRSGAAHASVVLLRLRDEAAANRVRVTSDMANVICHWSLPICQFATNGK
jgi:predicted nuclease of predicted toxin-antitoxin system